MFRFLRLTILGYKLVIGK